MKIGGGRRSSVGGRIKGDETMQATQVLRDEHEGILAMLAVVEAAALRLREGKSIPPDLMTNAVGFFRNFADRCHHSKEEDELFPKMVEHGIPKEGGPIGVMLMEHDQGRAFVRGMSEAAEQQQLYDAFEQIELKRTGPGEHERYHAMIAEYQMPPNGIATARSASPR
jgi:hemerythrin-like domain-containing protein